MKTLRVYILMIMAVLISLSYQPGPEKGIITKFKWRIVSATTLTPIKLNNRSKPTSDLFAASPECIKDDIFIFKNKGVFIVDDYNFPCTEPPSKNGKWKFIGTDSLLVDYGVGDLVVRYKITKLNSEQMILTTNMPFVPGGIDVSYLFKKVGVLK
jgi:hypothetical protein